MNTATLNRQALIRMREQEARLSQAEMARRMRIDNSSLCHIEKGRYQPAPSTFDAMVTVLAAAINKDEAEETLEATAKRIAAELLVQRDEAA